MVAQIDFLYLKTRPTRLWSRLLGYGLFEGRPLTTRGQWINPFLFLFFWLLKRLPILAQPKAPIFILGTGRSGTTILGLVLSMHRAVGFLNEPKAIYASLRNDEDLIGSYHRGRARYRLNASDATQNVCNAAWRIYGAYLSMSMTQRIVDKYPELIFRVPFVRQIFPDARFLFLSRNGWDTCASIEGWSARFGTKGKGESHDWWGVNRRKWNFLVEQIIVEHADLAAHVDALSDLEDHRAMAATEWIVTMREGIRLLEKYPDAVLHVPYETLCAEPSETCSHIAEFTGLAQDDVFLEYAQSVLSAAPTKQKFDLPVFLESPFHQVNEAIRLLRVG